MAISFHNLDSNFILPNKRIYKRWISNVISSESFRVGDISYVFCSEEEILNINKQFLSHNYYTDIITFPYTEDDCISADIYISVPTVKYNAQKFNQTFIHELNRVIIHGVLHLTGYDDLTDVDKIKMREAEDRSLEVLNTLL